MDSGNKITPVEPLVESLEETNASAAAAVSGDGSGSQTIAPIHDSPGVNLGSSSNSPDPNKTKDSLITRLRHVSSLYFWIYVALVIVAGLAIFSVIRSQIKPPPRNNPSSLTSQQLAQLQGSTTLVGDAKQILDIQSNSVFEGQVLVRRDLSVAGQLKIGGPFSLPSITVSGAGSFGQLQVGDSLSVGGNVNLQGAVSLQKNLNVTGSGTFGGTLSAAQLSVSTLQIDGDLSVRHIVLGGATPAKVNGNALGSGGTASVNGTDTAGTITINTGGGPTAGCLVTINFVQSFSTTPHVVVSPSNAAASALSFYTNRSNVSFSLCASGTPAGATTYLFDYIIFD